MSNAIEKLALAIYDRPTFDGDQIGVHLSHSPIIDATTETVEECRELCLQVCRDAVMAVLDTIREQADKTGSGAVCIPNEGKDEREK